MAHAADRTALREDADRDFVLLNLGCGTKCSPRAVNIDWSISLRLKASPLGRLAARALLTGERRRRFEAIPDSIVVHNLARSIPCPDGGADAIYHSHLLEHLDRDLAPAFLRRIFAKLKPGGILRIVVPDLHAAVLNYLRSYETCRAAATTAKHDETVAAIIEQSVRREAFGTSRQSPLRRRVENLLLGDARRRGETHKWCYDEVNLTELLKAAGFGEVRRMTFDSSSIPDWAIHGLDTDAHGGEYKPGSLYLEAVKPKPA
jgi:hypothetical protein